MHVGCVFINILDLFIYLFCVKCKKTTVALLLLFCLSWRVCM